MAIESLFCRVCGWWQPSLQQAPSHMTIKSVVGLSCTGHNAKWWLQLLMICYEKAKADDWFFCGQLPQTQLHPWVCQTQQFNLAIDLSLANALPHSPCQWPLYTIYNDGSVVGLYCSQCPPTQWEWQITTSFSANYLTDDGRGYHWLLLQTAPQWLLRPMPFCMMTEDVVCLFCGQLPHTGQHMLLLQWPQTQWQRLLFTSIAVNTLSSDNRGWLQNLLLPKHSCMTTEANVLMPPLKTAEAVHGLFCCQHTATWGWLQDTGKKDERGCWGDSLFSWQWLLPNKCKVRLMMTSNGWLWK